MYVCGLYVVVLLSFTRVFEGHMAWLVFMDKQTCFIEICAAREGFVTIQEGMGVWL